MRMNVKSKIWSKAVTFDREQRVCWHYKAYFLFLFLLLSISSPFVYTHRRITYSFIHWSKCIYLPHCNAVFFRISGALCSLCGSSEGSDSSKWTRRHCRLLRHTYNYVSKGKRERKCLFIQHPHDLLTITCVYIVYIWIWEDPGRECSIYMHMHMHRQGSSPFVAIHTHIFFLLLSSFFFQPRGMSILFAHCIYEYISMLFISTVITIVTTIIVIDIVM